MKRRTALILGTAFMATQLLFADHLPEAKESRINEQVRRELVTLPYYNVFDSFSFRVDGETVTLMGKVTRPTLKSSAEEVVKKVEGITTVRNEIEVLPLSQNDDRIRLASYQAIYGHTVLQTLAIRAVPPVHIIVENGHVTLEGYVANSMQKTVAGMQANSVPGVFSVTNNLLQDNAS